MSLGTSRISFGRQSDILDPDVAAAAHVTVCGLGTVGSHVAVECARLGIGNFTLYDMDEVEAHNVPSQAFHVADIDRPKTDACADRVRDVSDFANVEVVNARLEGGEVFPDGPVVMAVDNMDARKAILDMSVAWHPNHPLVIDARMAGKNLQVFAFDPCDDAEINAWAERWFPQEEASPIACGGRTVSFVGSFVGGLIAAMICNQLTGKKIPGWQQYDLGSFHTLKTKTVAASPNV